MIKLKFNSSGVLTESTITGVEPRQGSIGVELEVKFEGHTNVNTIATLNLKRSDNSVVSGVVLNNNNSDATKYSYIFDDAWFFAKAGTTILSVYITNSSGTTIASGQYQFAIEPTAYTDDPVITYNQYHALLAAIAGISTVDEISYNASGKTIKNLYDKIGSTKIAFYHLTGITNFGYYVGIISKTGDNYFLEIERFASGVRAAQDRWVARSLTGDELIESILTISSEYYLPYLLKNELKNNIIAHLDTLPTASESSPDFVQTPDGKLYRKKVIAGESEYVE